MAGKDFCNPTQCYDDQIHLFKRVFDIVRSMIGRKQELRWRDHFKYEERENLRLKICLGTSIDK